VQKSLPLTSSEIDSLLSSPDFALAQQLALEDQFLVHKLIQLRKAREISQTDIASKLGVSQAAISAFERLGNDPKLSTIRKYARAIGAMIRHQVDENGFTEFSESITHFSSESPTTTPTAAAWARDCAYVAETSEPYEFQQEENWDMMPMPDDFAIASYL